MARCSTVLLPPYIVSGVRQLLRLLAVVAIIPTIVGCVSLDLPDSVLVNRPYDLERFDPYPQNDLGPVVNQRPVGGLTPRALPRRVDDNRMFGSRFAPQPAPFPPQAVPMPAPGYVPAGPTSYPVQPIAPQINPIGPVSYPQGW